MYEQFASRNRETQLPDGSVVRWKVPGNIDRSFLIYVGAMASDVADIERMEQEGDTRGIIEVGTELTSWALRLAIKDVVLPDGSKLDLHREREPFASMRVNVLTGDAVADLLMGDYGDSIEAIAEQWLESLNEIDEPKKNDSEAQSQHSEQGASAEAAASGSEQQQTTKLQEAPADGADAHQSEHSSNTTVTPIQPRSGDVSTAQ